MKLLLNLFVLSAFCLLLGGCSGDTYLNVGNMEGGSELVFGPQNTSATLTINCNKDWSISSSADWCKYSMDSGRKTEIITISVDENLTGADRECTLTVRAEDESTTVRVTQRAGGDS